MRARTFDLVGLTAVATGAVAGHALFVAPLIERLTFESRVAVSCTVEAVPHGVACASALGPPSHAPRPGPAGHEVAAPFRAYALPGDRLRGVFEGRARFTPEGLAVSAHRWSLLSAAGDVRVRSVRLVLGSHDRPGGEVGGLPTPTPRLTLRQGEGYHGRSGMDLLLPRVGPRELARGDLALAVALESRDGTPLPDVLLRAEPGLTAALVDRTVRARAVADRRAIAEGRLRRRGAPPGGR